MAAQFNIEKESEEVFEFVCESCNIDGKVLQAKGYCSNCQDYLCDFCLKHHLLPKPMRHHVLFDEKSMPKDKKATPGNLKVSDTCTKRCLKHSGNIIEYYCQSHDFLGCTKCFISDNHRMCKGVICIKDATDGLYESSEYKTYTGKIGQIVDDLLKSSAVQQENEDNIKMYSIRAKREITSFRKSINEFLDRLEHEMDKHVSQMQESQTSKWMSTFKQIEKLDTDIKTIKRTEYQTSTSGQMCNSYVNMKRNVHQLKQLEDQMVTVQKENKVSEYNFKPDVNLQNIIKDTKTFGKLVTSKEGEAGYLSSTPSTTPAIKYAQTQTTTPTQISGGSRISDFRGGARPVRLDRDPLVQMDKSALIDALTTATLWLEEYECYPYCDKYRDAITSVKAGRRVYFDELPTFRNVGPLPRALWDAYNKFHGY